MTSVSLLAALLLFAPASTVPHGSMDPAAAAPPTENGTPAMDATKPAPAGTGGQGNSSTAAKPSPPPSSHHHRRKTAPH